MRKIFRREAPVTHEGREISLPYTGEGAAGVGKPLKSILHMNPDIPIYLGTGNESTVKLTAEIARCISEVLKPRGVGVVIEAVHQCMTTRGVHKARVSMVTSKMLGVFREDARTRAEFLRFIEIDGKS